MAKASAEERQAALEKLVGKENVETVLKTATEMSANAESFLASKEAADKAASEEAANTEKKGEDAATSAVAATKEVNAEFAAYKESQEKTVGELKLALKEQGDKFEAYKTETAKVAEKQAVDIAQLQVAYAQLMGVQPKNKGFKASEADATATNLSKEAADKAEEQEKAYNGKDDIINFVMGGKQPDAVAA